MAATAFDVATAAQVVAIAAQIAAIAATHSDEITRLPFSLYVEVCASRRPTSTTVRIPSLFLTTNSLFRLSTTHPLRGGDELGAVSARLKEHPRMKPLDIVPLLSPALFWVAVQVYHLFPALTRLPGDQVPMLVAAASTGTLFFIFTIPLAYWLAVVFSRAGINSMHRQTLFLKRMRNASRKRMIDNDKFDVD